MIELIARMQRYSIWAKAKNMENATGRNLIASFEIIIKINTTDFIFLFSQIVYLKSNLPRQKKI